MKTGNSFFLAGITLAQSGSTLTAMPRSQCDNTGCFMCNHTQEENIYEQQSS